MRFARFEYTPQFQRIGNQSPGQFPVRLEAILQSRPRGRGHIENNHLGQHYLEQGRKKDLVYM